MITKLQILLLAMSLIDLGATFFYVSTFHTKFPTIDYTTLEANPILRMAWKQFGLHWGMIIGGIIVFGIFALLIFTIQDKWKQFFAGALSMMIIYHILNFSQLARMKPA